MVSSYPNGFANGLTVRGMPVNVMYPGQVFFVNNSSVLANGGNNGSDLNPGTYQRPLATLAQAMTNCTASRGDIIMLMPGHAETVSSSTAMTWSKAGVIIVGLGEGNLRPTITLDTANTATINVSAANISVVNVLFKANFLNIAALFTTTAAKNFSTDNCEFKDTSAVLNFVTIVDTNTTSNDTDGLSIEKCQWFGLGTGTNSCLIKMDGTNDRLFVRNNYVTHAAVTAAGLMPIAAGKVVTNALIDRNVINLVGATSTTTGIIITTNGSTNSGVISNNLITSLDATTEILVTASSGFKYFANYYTGAADTSGYLLPVADA